MFSVCDSEVKQMKTAEHIIETVDKLVRKYHTRDPYELCQLLGIKIHYYDLQKKLKGFFYYQSRQKNIVIDHNVNGILERILVAHELGHAVLHTKIAMMHGFQEMEVFDDRDSHHIPTWVSAAKRLSSSNYFYPDGSPFCHSSRSSSNDSRSACLRYKQACSNKTPPISCICPWVWA